MEEYGGRTAVAGSCSIYVRDLDSSNVFIPGKFCPGRIEERRLDMSKHKYNDIYPIGGLSDH